MKTSHLTCLLLLGALALASAQGVRLQGGIAAAGGAATGTTVRSSGQAGEGNPVGHTASESFILSSGARVPGEVQRILQYVLTEGWHVLGSPGTSDTNAGDIFVGARGATIKVGPVQYYNSDTFRYVAGADEQPLQPRMGFWLFSYWGGESRTFTAPSGIRTADWLSEIPRGSWVLYSPPGKIVLGEELGRTVYGWDTESQSYVELDAGDYLEPLRGYWVYRMQAELE